MKKMTLYHGSYTKVKQPDLQKCEDGKDFGKGFYLTTSKAQAERFCKTSVRKAIKNGRLSENQSYGYVNIFEFELSEDVSLFEFSGTDATWLRCVGGHRKKDLFHGEIERWQEYDIISGKIANDTTNRVILNYISGDYGDPDEESAVNFAITLLRTNKLSDQECFRTEKALNCLKYVDSYEVSIE